ncbi:MAG: sensor histidine kinase [Maribacter sp.]
MDIKFWKSKKRLKKWAFRSFIILTALAIIIFNDAFGDNEPFQIFAFFYFLLLIFLFIRWVFKQVRLIIKLKNEKAKTELLHLKSQVNPHFFFNTLNNLYGLVGKDPDKAQILILKLSDMMRYSIYEGEREFVTLEEEVVYLKNYVQLHKMRYHKKIEVQFEENIKNPGFHVMPLLFILLLENAFKHGVENLRKHAFINIALTANESEVHFSVTNNFDADEISKESGIGLKNLKRRLELAYPDKHSLSLKKKGDIYKAQLSLRQL